MYIAFDTCTHDKEIMCIIHTHLNLTVLVCAAQPRLIDVRPDLLKEIVLSELSSHVDPKTLTMGSQRKLTWECKKCPEGMAHIWQVRGAAADACLPYAMTAEV